jgi:hypothetical protein
MNNRSILLFLLLFLPALLSYSLGAPETAITRTHLMKDIDPKSITLAVAGDLVREKPEAVHYADFLVVYLGYSPWAWLEFGVALHSIWSNPLAGLEGKIDLMEFINDSSRVSCLLIGGFGGYREDGAYSPVVHGGLALNLRVREDLQLYLGAGTDSLSQALSIQTGLYVSVLDWLGFSLSFKLAVGPEGTEPMLSAAPVAVIY